MDFKQFKKKYKLTNKKIADELGMSTRTVASWGTGERQIPAWQFFLIEFYYEHTAPAQREETAKTIGAGVEEL